MEELVVMFFSLIFVMWFNVHGEWEPSAFGPAVIVRWEEWIVRRLTPKGA